MNSAIDSEKGYQYSGGKVLAITPSGGMSGETTNCSNFTSVGVKTTISLTTSSILTVKNGSTTIVTIKVPCSISALVAYLGTSSASISTASSSNVSFDNNGVYWN